MFFQPRAGFAWSLAGSDHTVVRGGIGLFYDKVPLNIRGFSRYPRRTVTSYATDGQTIIGVVEFRNVLVQQVRLKGMTSFRSIHSIPWSGRSIRAISNRKSPVDEVWLNRADCIANTAIP